MKTKTLLLFLVALSFKSLLAADVVLNNFESSSPAVSALYGATFASVANPNSTGYNTTANCAKIGRTEGSWWELIQFPVSFTIPANTKQYIHILANYYAQPDISIRIDGSTDIRATNLYTNLGQWQDLVFEISGGASGTTVTTLMILTDLGFNNSPAGQILNNTDKFGYMDEITLNNNPLPLGSTYLMGNNLYDFEAGTANNITGVLTFANATNPVSYPVTNPYNISMNTTNNVGKRTSDGSQSLWYAGFGFTFTNPVLVDATHKYLHIMMIVPANGQTVSFDVSQGATKVMSDELKTISAANTWQDVVFDVSSMAYISSMAIKCGTATATSAGDYYFDEIRIDNDPTPRSNTTTSLNITNSNSKIYSSNGNIVIENNSIAGIVNVFNSCGQRVVSKEIGANTSITVKNKGLYFVNIGNETTKVIVK
jgi:hypothetical protein